MAGQVESGSINPNLMGDMMDLEPLKAAGINADDLDRIALRLRHFGIHYQGEVAGRVIPLADILDTPEKRVAFEGYVAEWRASPR